ncbi:SH3 domain-containing protein [Leptospira bouyouniensis]|uniref:SH3 domain-containing protein n=1 Tax=Leptospira bouyouniensis TaxID=2484911 RepID=A0ABY2L247_9LEPT|nr:SH3 domain-containing protein [Leptospira bouyouniensis]TGK48030.1 SH3 domain-containing protein [Leptospira bouyouniensis]
MYIKKKLFLFFVFLILNFGLTADEVPKSELLSYWNKTLAKFNYSLPSELEKNFIKSEYTGGGSEDQNTFVYVTQKYLNFPNENVNFAIFFVNKAYSQTGSSVKLAAYFRNEKLVMLTTNSPYSNVEGRYEFSGITVRKGLTYEYDVSGELTISCLVDRTRETTSEIISKQYCGESILVGPQNSILKVIKHKTNCENECTAFYPFREKGIYYVTRNNANLRRESHSKGIVLKFLPKDSKVELLEDTFQQEWIKGLGTANYVKVRLDDGGEGYLHGAYLRAPGEPDVTLIRERAEEWKRKNGVKGK